MTISKAHRHYHQAKTFSADLVRKEQHHGLPVNKHPLHEQYHGAKVRKHLFESLDKHGVAYPPIEDEAHVSGKVRTTWAKVDKAAGTLIVGLDNAAYHTKGYEGLTKGERRFASQMADYAKEHGLTAVFLAHLPPTTQPKKMSDKEFAAQQKWYKALAQKHPDSLWVNGHTHHAKLFDVNGSASKVSNVVVGGEVKDTFTKITTYANGRKIERFRLEEPQPPAKPDWSRKIVETVTLSRDGKKVDPAQFQLGAAKGVLYGLSDVQHEPSLVPFYKQVQADAQLEDARGLSISYLDVGDHTVKHRIPVLLPHHEKYFFVPGNHDYYNHGNLRQVVDSFNPAKTKVPFRIDYVK
jgi:hypothetical protein